HNYILVYKDAINMIVSLHIFFFKQKTAYEIYTMAKQLSALLGKGLPTGVIVEVFVLSIPFIVAVTLPMAVLVAVLHVFTRLAADNEITAMQAGGVSVGRVIAPTLAGAAGIALLSFLWNDQLLPR